MSDEIVDRPVTDPGNDERILRPRKQQSIIARPGFGAGVGIVVVFTFFAVGSSTFTSPAGIANWLDPASLIGLSAIPVALLMIAGEFDLSAGVMITSSSLVTAVFATQLGLNLWLALLISLLFSVAVGFINGVLVIKTRLPSFIITLGTFFVLQGLNQGVIKLITGTVRVDSLDAVPGYSSVYSVLASSFSVSGATIQIAKVWWLVIQARMYMPPFTSIIVPVTNDERSEAKKRFLCSFRVKLIGLPKCSRPGSRAIALRYACSRSKPA